MKALWDRSPELVFEEKSEKGQPCCKELGDLPKVWSSSTTCNGLLSSVNLSLTFSPQHLLFLSSLQPHSDLSKGGQPGLLGQVDPEEELSRN